MQLSQIDKYMDDKLSMSLGSGLVSLIDLTNAYSMIVNGGIEISPKLVVSVQNKSGEQIINNEVKQCLQCFQIDQDIDFNLPNITSEKKLILDPRIAYQITSMMEGVIDRGTAKKLKSLELTLAGKTGTTNENKDAWFIGYSPDLVGVKITSESLPLMIDEIPIMCVVAAYAKGETVIEGIDELRVKESDRVEAIIHNMKKMNGLTHLIAGNLVGTPKNKLHNTTIDSFGDHRIFMAFYISNKTKKG